MRQIVGQSRAIAVLHSALAAGRPHHAYIFHGPVGVGKFTSALAFAQILLCHDRQTDLTGQIQACDACESCRLLATQDQAHPDLHVVTKELAAVSSNPALRSRKQMNIPIDLLRERVVGGSTSDNRYHEAAAYRTTAMRHGKIFIIDEAELMEAPAQNVLLKTLEEPPADTYFILVTASEHKLLMTIRSRCHRVAFVPLGDEIVTRWLAEHAPDLDQNDRDWLANFAAGSIGRAKLAVTYNLKTWAQQIVPALEQMAAKRTYPVSLGADLAKMIDDFATRWVDEHDGASKEAANRFASTLVWTIITQHARARINSLAPQCAGDDAIIAETKLEPWLGVIDALGDAERELASKVNMGMVTDHLVSRIFRSLTSVTVA